MKFIWKVKKSDLRFGQNVNSYFCKKYLAVHVQPVVVIQNIYINKASAGQ